jgi:aspartyl aminopeptidase
MQKIEGPFATSAESLVTFLDASPTGWHAAEQLRLALDGEGFTLLDEADPWSLEPSGRYMVMRNGSALLAFVVGTKTPCDVGMRLVGAHTDSPALKIKPNPSGARNGYVTLGVEVYGGPVLATWVDRDLRIAGRVALRTADDVETRLVTVDDPLVVVPGLAIHLDRKVNDEGLKVNAQDNLPAVLGLDAEGVDADRRLVELLAATLSVKADAIKAWDLMLVDAQGAAFSGQDRAFLRSMRLDDQAMCHAAREALLRSAARPREFTRVAVFYDNEEVGSATPQGAVSPWLGETMERIVLAHEGGREHFMRAVSRSTLVSADMAHAINPNHAGKHDARHSPVMGGGPVLKVNASMRYATDATGWEMFERACAKVDVPVQRYVNRSDLPCGSTIGPLASSRIGLKTIDVGNPIFAMHSIRETQGTADHEYMIRALASFLDGA